MLVQSDPFVVDLDLLALFQIVVHNHLAAGSNHRAPQLNRSEPVGVDMRNLAALKEQSQISDILRTSRYPRGHGSCVLVADLANPNQSASL